MDLLERKGITQKWHVNLRDNSPSSLHWKETSISPVPAHGSSGKSAAGQPVVRSGRGRSRACRLRTNNIELPLLPAAALIGSLPCLLVPGGREYNGIGLRDSHWKGGRGVVFCRPPSVRAGARPAVIYWIWKLDNWYVFLGRRSTANPCFLNAYVA